jgi:hypothetical protein
MIKRLSGARTSTKSPLEPGQAGQDGKRRLRGQCNDSEKYDLIKDWDHTRLDYPRDKRIDDLIEEQVAYSRLVKKAKLSVARVR